MVTECPKRFKRNERNESGAVELFDPQLLNQLGSLVLPRPTLAHFTATTEELQQQAEALFDGLGNGRLRVRIDRVLPIEEAAEAHRILEARETSGKVLLRISWEHPPPQSACGG